MLGVREYGMGFRVWLVAVFTAVTMPLAIAAETASFNPPSVVGTTTAVPHSRPASLQFDAISLSSGMFRDWLPSIPNLQLGFNYFFGNNLRQSIWSADYVLPVNVTYRDTVFGEAHVSSLNYKSTTWVPFLANFWSLTSPGADSRTDLALGVGYRRMVTDDAMLGLNTFYDATRLFGTWHSSGSVGLEIAANGPGGSAIDLNANWYSSVYGPFNSRGSVFPTFNIVNDLRTGHGSFDIEAGYSQPVFEQALDLRISLNAYSYELQPERKYGLKSGAELTTRNGLFRVVVAYGHDGVYGSYGNVAAYVDVGFHAENILYGQNPFTMPDPVFKSPRNLRRLLSQPVKRHWAKPGTVVANSRCEGEPPDSMFATPDPTKNCFYGGGGDIPGFQGGINACHSAGLYTIQNTLAYNGLNTYIGSYSVPPYVYKRDAEPMWACSSSAYVRATQTVNVRAYVRCDVYASRDSLFFSVELPALIERPDVQSITIYSNCAGGADWVIVEQPK